MKMLALLLAVTANDYCPGYRSDGQSPAAIALRACVGPRITTLERSGESPGDIATAILSSCSQPIDASLVETSACKEPREQRLARQAFVGVVRDYIIAQVVELRARASVH